VKEHNDTELLYLILRPLPDPGHIPVAVRLRMLLKTALRRDKLRCVGLAQLRPVKTKAER
jgi:hypothetical protein